MTAAEFWDAEAGDFDLAPDHGLHDPAVRAAWSSLLLPLMPVPHARVADLGCGTGSLSLLLTEAGHRVAGLDISPKMVRLALDKFGAAGHEADLRVGDAAVPPWPAASFDVVMSRHVLWAMADPDAALARWIELLAPGGALVLIEGLWWTNAGMSAAQVSEAVLGHRCEAELRMLDDAAFWGGAISDERFAIISRC